MTKQQQAKANAEQVARKVLSDKLGKSPDDAAVQKVAKRLYSTIPREAVAA